MAEQKKKLPKNYSKSLMDRDYIIMVVLLAIMVLFAVLGIDAIYISAFAGLWAVQLGYSSGCYFAKAKAENLIKLPAQLLKSLPEDMKEKADPNEIIASVFSLKE